MSQKDRDKETKGKQGNVTPEGFAEAYGDFVTGMMVKGYRLYPSEAGNYAGHKVYVRQSLTVNSDVKVWRDLPNCSDIYRKSYLSTISAVAMNLMEGAEDEYREVILKIANTFLLQPRAKNTALYGYASNLMSDNKGLKRSISGDEAFKHIPLKSWFPRLNGLKPYELLSLFPKPEAQAMLMLLGRAVCGSNGTTIDDLVIEHKMRAAGIVVGLEAGLGKSTLLEYIREGLKELGFTDTSLSGSNKFGMGRIAQADLAYRDDLTMNQQKDMLTNNELKTIITGGTFKVEEKGGHSYDCESRTILIALTNKYSITQFFGMDSGSISRFHFLYTYCSSELATVYPGEDARTLPKWKALADQYKCTTLELSCYLLACAAEYFLDVIGYGIGSNGLIERVGKDKSQAKFEALTQEYRYKPYISHTDKLVESVGEMVALAIARAGRDDEEVKAELFRRCEHSSFNFDLLMASVSYYCQSTTKEAFDLHSINTSCKESIQLKLYDLKNSRQTKNTTRAFEEVTRELINVDASPYPHTIYHYCQSWDKVRMSVRSLAEKYERAGFKSVASNKPLLQSLDSIAHHL